MTLLDRADRAFDEALKALNGASARQLADSLATAQADLTAPMRVAVIGRVKAGKSTLMNALLGAEVAPTGPVELTYNVNTFVHAPERALTVHFRDAGHRNTLRSTGSGNWSTGRPATRTCCAASSTSRSGCPTPCSNGSS